MTGMLPAPQVAASPSISSPGLLSRFARLLGVPGELLLALLALGVVLTATVVPAPFIIDDINYLTNVVALRQGHVALPATAGSSAELAFFDPGSESRVVTSTPVASNAPPLYAPIAFPFSFMGWRGLVALNTIAYLATIVMVFRHTRRYATQESSAWLAAAAFALAGFSLEYAQGLWPYSLSVALCTAGLLLVARRLEGGSDALALLGGFLLAVGTGIRYQNAVLVVGAGGAIVLWAPRRFRATFAYGGGAIVRWPSARPSITRLGSWNPISKGPDEGRDAPILIDELLASGRRVCVLLNGMPRPVLERVAAGWEVTLNPGRGGTIDLRAKRE